MTLLTRNVSIHLVVSVAVSLAGCGARVGLGDPDPTSDAGTRPDARVSSDAGADAGHDASMPIEDGGSADASAGSDIGEPCATGSECDSSAELMGSGLPACLMAGTWPNGGAWLDGYCTAFCAPPPPIQDGAPLERRDCPERSLCVPLRTGEVGICLRSCDTDADCRTDDEYFCRRHFGLSLSPPTTTNGVCVSYHCRSRGCDGSADCDC
jgi:hypothetical protein